MISTATEYYQALFKLTEGASIYPSIAKVLPRQGNIYTIDLDSREIKGPTMLSVAEDHDSETIYFLTDRFYDNTDLATTCCIIQYINAANEGRIYWVPYYDTETYLSDNKILIPWCIEGEATKAAGSITYSLRFFKLNDTYKYLIYNLNTLPTTSIISNGINILNEWIPVEVSKEIFEMDPSIYYIENDTKDGYVPAKDIPWSASLKYYTLTDGYNYEASFLEFLMSKVASLQRDTQSYWYDATDSDYLDS